jgi:hypothetical protein
MQGVLRSPTERECRLTGCKARPCASAEAMPGEALPQPCAERRLREGVASRMLGSRVARIHMGFGTGSEMSSSLSPDIIALKL